MDPKVIQPYRTKHAYSAGIVRGLFIGINYRGSRAQLQGCVNDVSMMLKTLEHIGFPLQEAIILVDDPKFPGVAGTPTKENIIKYMKWLSHGVKAGDTLFLHYSGHGSQQRNYDGTEEDGFDETLIPVDYQRKGVIVDDDIYNMVVRNLPAGVRVTAVMDCCHSGTLMDLPYEFEMGSGKKPKARKRRGIRAMIQTVMDEVGLDQSSHGGAGGASGAGRFRRTNRNRSNADVILFSGCDDSQTSADVKNMSSFKTAANSPGRAGGACTGALAEAFSGTKGLTVVQLLLHMRDSLRRRRFTQVPQLSSTKTIDMNKPFSMFGSLADGVPSPQTATSGHLPSGSHLTSAGRPPPVQAGQMHHYQAAYKPPPLVQYQPPQQLYHMAPTPYFSNPYQPLVSRAPPNQPMYGPPSGGPVYPQQGGPPPNAQYPQPGFGARNQQQPMYNAPPPGFGSGNQPKPMYNAAPPPQQYQPYPNQQQQYPSQQQQFPNQQQQQYPNQQQQQGNQQPFLPPAL